MHFHRVVWVPALSISMLCGLLPATASAARPWNRIVSFRQLDADPQNSYPLTEENGPWMIMATTFSGEGAEDQARQLVFELRRSFKLPAYSYKKRFDFTKGTEGRGVDRNTGGPLTMKYQRGGEIEEIAVLVGDYQNAGDAEAQRVLKQLKYAQPETLKVKDGASTSQTLAALRTVQQKMLPDGKDRKKKGPMAHAFVTRNPLLPAEYFVPKGVDKLVLEMNQGVKHGLLDCPEKYTVKVATFLGNAVILDQKTLAALEKGAQPKSKLVEAADNAHTLTEALRAKGYEAYEFHDRSSSIVTVGSFSAVGTPRSDGKIEINPQVHKIMQTFGAETKVIPGQAAPQVGKPKTLLGIPFDVQPLPVEIPKRSVSSDYARYGQ